MVTEPGRCPMRFSTFRLISHLVGTYGTIPVRVGMPARLDVGGGRDGLEGGV